MEHGGEKLQSQDKLKLRFYHNTIHFNSDLNISSLTTFANVTKLRKYWMETPAWNLPHFRWVFPVNCVTQIPTIHLASPDTRAQTSDLPHYGQVRYQLSNQNLHSCLYVLTLMSNLRSTTPLTSVLLIEQTKPTFLILSLGFPIFEWNLAQILSDGLSGRRRNAGVNNRGFNPGAPTL